MSEWQLLDSFIKTTDGGGSEEELEQMQRWRNVREAAGPFHSLCGWPTSKQPVWATRPLYLKSGFSWDHGAPAGEIQCHVGNFSVAGGWGPTAPPNRLGRGVKNRYVWSYNYLHWRTSHQLYAKKKISTGCSTTFWQINGNVDLTTSVYKAYILHLVFFWHMLTREKLCHSVINYWFPC